MHIERVTTPSDELFVAFQQLIPQLTANHPVPSRNDIDFLVSSTNTIVLVARVPDKDGSIAGTATIIIYRVPTGMRAHLEDVIVDEQMRGMGIGEALTLEALRFARAAGADGVALTSHSRRQAANRLYQKLGFKPWETNLYFYKFDNDE